MRHAKFGSILVAGVATLSLGLVPLAAADPGTLDDTEIAAVQLAREEERLSRDLYQAFAANYDGARPFSNITRGEQRHFDHIGTLITNHGLTDPSAGLEPGTYADPALQQLYDSWYAQGMNSIQDAYQVGIELEQRDIADLDLAIAGTDNPDVRATFELLRDGARSHLTAFERAAAGQLGAGQQVGQQGRKSQADRPGSCDGTGRQAGPGDRTSGPRQGNGGRARGAGAGAGTGDCPNQG